MTDQLPVRKYITVWIKSRKNPPRKGGPRTVSRTLEWVEYGRRSFLSLGKHATAAYARQAKADKERELNSPGQRQSLDPICWEDFRKRYLDTTYPGHELAGQQRDEASAEWNKSVSSMRAERLAMDNFQRLVMNAEGRDNTWCHEVTAGDRDRFATARLREVKSAESADADLRNLRTIFNVMEEWKHRPERSNPFAGRKKATVGARRKRVKEVAGGAKKAEHYSRAQLAALLDQADREARERPDDWGRHRLRALVYFEAHTGARVGEVLHLEWDREVPLAGGGNAREVDFDRGVAFLCWKVEHGLKTEGSEAPLGLPDALIAVLREWKERRTCNWVFPNSHGTPWTSGGEGYRPLDQLKELAGRAGIGHATWKMFRHSLTTHGKQWFGLSKEQMAAQLRHDDEETQKHYDQADLANLREAVKNIDFRPGRESG
jgi:integrase